MNKTIAALFYSLSDDSCRLAAFVVFPPDPCKCDPGVTASRHCGTKQTWPVRNQGNFHGLMQGWKHAVL